MFKFTLTKTQFKFLHSWTENYTSDLTQHVKWRGWIQSEVCPPLTLFQFLNMFKFSNFYDRWSDIFVKHSVSMNQMNGGILTCFQSQFCCDSLSLKSSFRCSGAAQLCGKHCVTVTQMCIYTSMDIIKNLNSKHFKLSKSKILTLLTLIRQKLTV